MRILWITPWFGDYRVSVYKFLNTYSNDNFYLIYSKAEVNKRIQEKLDKELGNHAIGLTKYKSLELFKSKSNFSGSELIIRRQPELLPLIKKINPDIIITEGFGGWAPKGIFYSVIHRRKLLMFYERTAYVERNSPWWRQLYRMIIGKPVNHFLINGSLTREYLNNELNFRSKNKTEGVMCADSYGLSTSVKSVSIAEKTELRNSFGLKSNGLLFLFVGQIVKRKGVEEMLYAWEKHLKEFPNDRLLVLGEGVLLEELRNKYKHISYSAFLLGAVDYDIIYKYYACADVFFMPTLEDNWCLVVPEAMACGLPIACSIYNGGHVELIKDGVNGFNFDPLNISDTLQILSRFHNCDLKEMGKQSILLESNYTPDKGANRIYQACLKEYKTNSGK